MPFSWSDFAAFIVRLSRVALEWYREVSGDSDDKEMRKRVAVALDPDEPEDDPRNVEV